jgi:hypothetical protein
MHFDRIDYKRIGDQAYIFDTKTGYVYLLSETASIVVEGVLNNSLEGAVTRILKEYDIDEETLRQDVRELCDLLEELCVK